MTEETRQTDDDLWDVADVARYLKVSEATVRNLIRDGEMPFRRVGGLIRFVPDEVRRWVSTQPAA
jgi:excisionase family DNA binding protein